MLSVRTGRFAALFAVLIAASALVAVPGVAQEWAGKTTTEDGVTHVWNPSQPLYSSEAIALEEVWRLGGYSDAEEEFFGVIADIATDDAGNIYLVDAQLSEVKVFDINGNYLKTVGREGEGPGEFRRPISLTKLPDGRLGVIQAWPSKMVLFTIDGEPDGDLPFEAEGKGFGGMRKARLAGDRMAVLYNFGNPGEDGFSMVNALGMINTEGEVEDKLREGGAKMDYANSLCIETEWNGFESAWAAAPTGWVAARDEFADYAVTVWNPDGAVQHVIHREYPAHKRTGDEIQEIKDTWAAGIARWVPNPSFEIEDNWNPVEDIHLRKDGTLLVRNSRARHALADGEMARFDVFDPQGRYIQEVILNGEFDPDNDGMYIVDNYVFVVTDLISAARAFRGGGGDGEDEDIDEDADPMEIICYRVAFDGLASK